MSPDLAQRWKHSPKHLGHPFIEDGVVDPDSWSKAPRRVLFLLKEAYPGRGRDHFPSQSTGFDLRAEIQKYSRIPRRPMWRRVSSWTYLLQNIDKNYTPAFESDVRQTLTSIAVVNIRKSGGTSQSLGDVICGYASVDRSLLREQISEISPDLILAGGVWDAVKLIWPDDERQKLAVRFHLTPNGPLINFCHPAAQLNNELLYFALAGIVQAALTVHPEHFPLRRP